MKPLTYRCPWFSIRMAADEIQPAVIQLYGRIGQTWLGDGTTAKQFVDVLNEIPTGREITLRVASEGGAIFDGLAIYHNLLQRRNHLTAINDGYALSTAGFIMMAAGKIQTPPTARFMMHTAQGLVMGDSADFRKMADALDRESANIAAIFAERTGQSSDYWLGKMESISWFNGEQAVDEGLADEVIEAPVRTMNVAELRKIFVSVPDFASGPTPSHNQNPAAPSGGANAEIMNKKLVIALLAKHGITQAENAADELLVTELDKLVTAGKITAAQKTEVIQPANVTPAPAAAATPPVVVNTSGSGTPSLTDILAAMRDQTAVVNSLITVLRPNAGNLGTDPLSRSGIQNLGNPLIEEYRKMPLGAARNEWRMQHHTELLNIQTSFNPQNANTIAAGLVTDYLSDAVITVTSARLAPLELFSTDFGTDRMKPLSTVQVRKFTTGQAPQTAVKTPPSIASYEVGDSTLAAVSVVMNEVSKSFFVDNREMNSGSRLAHLAEGSARIFANALSDIWTPLLTTGNFSNPAFTNVGAADSTFPAKLPTVLGKAKNFTAKNLIIDGAYIAQLAPVNTFSFGQIDGGFNGAFGFDAIRPQNRFTSSGTNVVGLACGTTALAVASGLPMALPAQEYLALTTVDTKVGLVVQSATWWSRATRSYWSSYDIMFGAAVGDSTDGNILTSA